MWPNYYIEGCGLQILDEHLKALLGSSLIFSGLLGATVNGWLVATLYLKAEVLSWSHLLLLNTGISCLGRGLLAGFPFSATSALAGRWLFGHACCKLYAFLHHLFSIAELFSITLLAVERYHLTRHSHLSECTYTCALLTMWMVSMGWALLPLLDFGRYVCDTAGIACELDWHGSDRNHLYYNMSYVTLGVGLAVIITVYSLLRAVTSPLTKFHSSGHEQRYITKAVIFQVFGMYILWLPQTVVALWKLVNIKTQLPASFVFLGPLCAEVSAIVPTLSFLFCEPRLRCTLMGMHYNENYIKLSKMKKRKHGCALYGSPVKSVSEELTSSMLGV